ncbi:DUF1178 family protein [uncultured Lentibacter sp.]|jgi:hypothetical protein|uniref:DUF1178 family protein n=1 Tax=uncultured Lentibacter sp. TaxID=1659309 RepID=UPI00261AE63C|nr:DUF1178 family protein [uncultured Lentibacter sp.]
MISFSLKCAQGHSFDSWFQSSEAYEKLQQQGMVACAVCGDSAVTKSLMAPRVSRARSKGQPGALSQPASPAEQALKDMRKKIEATSEYVGPQFATEARKMHLGEAPERAIYGEARLEEAKKLMDEGVPVTPLPFKPNRRSN